MRGEEGATNSIEYVNSSAGGLLELRLVRKREDGLNNYVAYYVLALAVNAAGHLPGIAGTRDNMARSRHSVPL